MSISIVPDAYTNFGYSILPGQTIQIDTALAAGSILTFDVIAFPTYGTYAEGVNFYTYDTATGTLDSLIAASPTQAVSNADYGTLSFVATLNQPIGATEIVAIIQSSGFGLTGLEAGIADGDAYANGSLAIYFNVIGDNDIYTDRTTDLAFSFAVTPASLPPVSAVPEPSSAVLIGIALVVGAVIAKLSLRIQRRQRTA